MRLDLLSPKLLAAGLAFLLLPWMAAAAEPAKTKAPSAAASQIADFFSKVGDKIYEDCIFELSEEQLEVQRALIAAYVNQGASSTIARRLAVKQIVPPKLSPECERIRGLPKGAEPNIPGFDGPPKPAGPTAPPAKKPVIEALPKLPPADPAQPIGSLASKPQLPQWDCAPGVDYVTIKHKGYDRKLTGGEICNPFEDVVNPVPASSSPFKFGYTIKTGRLFVISDDPKISGKTIAWALSGRDICRNNPDPDCFAARAIGPLPPGEYSFNDNLASRVSWGPKTKRQVAGIYLSKLWNKERFSAQHLAAIKARGNIAIHVRLKGEMSEACLGLEPKGWAYIAQLIKEGRVNGLNAYIDEPYPQVAEKPPVIVASTFSLTSLFK